MPLQKNQILTLRIERLSSDGSGVAHSADGEAVFVPGTAPGDEARVRIVKDCGRYAFGILDASGWNPAMYFIMTTSGCGDLLKVSFNFKIAVIDSAGTTSSASSHIQYSVVTFSQMKLRAAAKSSFHG